jgi:chain length determinant protein EpsF
MTFQQFLQIFSVRRKIVLRTMFGLVFITVLLSLILPKQYTGSVDVLVDVKSPDPVEGIVLPALALPAYMATQTDIIGSRRVAMRVIKLLKLDSDPGIIQDWRDDTAGKGDITVWLADKLLKKLDVKPSKESNVITLSYEAHSPEAAAAIANAFAQAYIDTNLELRIAPASQNAQWFKEQSKILRDNLEQAQSRLSEFQQKNSIVGGSDNGFDYELAKLNGLTEQLTLSQTQTADSLSKQSAGAAANVLPEVIQNPLVQQLKASIAQNEAKLAQLSRSFGVNYPDYVRLKDETGALKQQLDTQISRVAASISMANKTGETKENVLKEAIAEQKRKVLEMTALRDQMAVLQKDVDTAQKAYDAVAQRFTETNLESQSNVTNISVLTPAAVPIKHSSPKLVLNTLIAIFMGALLGMGAALGLEMIDRRIHSAEDITAALGIPVLAELIPMPVPSVRKFRLPAFIRRPRSASPAAPASATGV